MNAKLQRYPQPAADGMSRVNYPLYGSKTRNSVYNRITAEARASGFEPSSMANSDGVQFIEINPCLRAYETGELVVWTPPTGGGYSQYRGTYRDYGISLVGSKDTDHYFYQAPTTEEGVQNLRELSTWYDEAAYCPETGASAGLPNTMPDDVRRILLSLKPIARQSLDECGSQPLVVKHSTFLASSMSRASYVNTQPPRTSPITQRPVIDLRSYGRPAHLINASAWVINGADAPVGEPVAACVPASKEVKARRQQWMPEMLTCMLAELSLMDDGARRRASSSPLVTTSGQELERFVSILSKTDGSPAFDLPPAEAARDLIRAGRDGETPSWVQVTQTKLGYARSLEYLVRLVNRDLLANGIGRTINAKVRGFEQHVVALPEKLAAYDPRISTQSIRQTRYRYGIYPQDTY